MPIVAGAEAWSHDGGPTAVMLVHDFNGSPGTLRPWGTQLAGRGLTVRVPRLPGHGTSWREANLTRWPDWFAAVDRTLTELRAGHAAVVVAGLGMGAALALRLAVRRPDEVTGLILVNPSVAHEDPRKHLAVALSRALPTWPAAPPDVHDPAGAPLDAPRQVPMRAYRSLPDLWDEVRPLVPAVTAPTLLVTSATDHVVDPSDSDWVASTIGSTDLTQVVLQNSYHLAPIDGDRELLLAASAQFIDRLAGTDADHAR